ncbi:reverse transcriptase-like protein [Virgibacillus ndiopensis]|uniref:reverse transcriptase-like protein n=1 Tax=Virgibacillus ndiopensis TaxID=2004408 RepID=UPI001FE574DF|nr:reverse transcriptase-like protein [Virgibacillus ndiopensis]
MKVKLKWIYKGKKTEALEFESAWAAQESMEIVIADIEKTGRVKELVVIDEMGNEWTQKEFSKLKETIEQEPHDIVVYFDGGFDWHTGTAGLGVVIYYQKSNKKYRLRVNQQIKEMETNNEAEYAALHFAVIKLEEMGVHHLPCTFRGDAQGVLKQLEGVWPCYEENLNAWLDRIEDKLGDLGIKPTYEAIGRNENKEADRLATQALNRVEIFSEKEV